MALASGHVVKPSNGWYSRVNAKNGEVEDKKFRLDDTDTKEFWLPILTDPTFNEYVKNKYSVGSMEMMGADEEDTNV
jgi:L,D-peptidoglycan transpeptidase YkuD (ErfK/YbiS/YcfS/YnhG family)